jgi:hypothetical protein
MKATHIHTSANPLQLLQKSLVENSPSTFLALAAASLEEHPIFCGVIIFNTASLQKLQYGKPASQST